MHAGMVGKTAIERIARVPVYVDIASEFLSLIHIFCPLWSCGPF